MSMYGQRLKEFRTNEFQSSNVKSMGRWDVAGKMNGDTRIVAENIKKDERGRIEGPHLSVKQVVRIADILKLDNDSAIQLVARRMSEEYLAGDNWGYWKEPAAIIIKRYSKERDDVMVRA